VTQLKDYFRNVIICEDIREETGNKKSLMGVIGGDLLVPSFPANIQIAIYSEFDSPDKQKDLSITLTLHVDELDIAKAEIHLPALRETVGIIALPRGIVIFEKESAFRVTVTLGDETCEIVSKKVMAGPST
jgi:hypothetical protein